MQVDFNATRKDTVTDADEDERLIKAELRSMWMHLKRWHVPAF